MFTYYGRVVSKNSLITYVNFPTLEISQKAIFERSVTNTKKTSQKSIFEFWKEFVKTDHLKLIRISDIGFWGYGTLERHTSNMFFIQMLAFLHLHLRESHIWKLQLSRKYKLG